MTHRLYDSWGKELIAQKARRTPIDRRLRRSRRTKAALTLWLSSVARRSSAEGLVIADDRGLLVAASIDARRAEVVAACLPIYAKAKERGRALTNRARVPIHAARINFNGEEFFLGVVGETATSQASLRSAEAGFQRIMHQA